VLDCILQGMARQHPHFIRSASCDAPCSPPDSQEHVCHPAPFPLLTRLGRVGVAAQEEHELALVRQGLGFNGARQCLPPLRLALAGHPVVLLVGQEHLGAKRQSRGKVGLVNSPGGSVLRDVPTVNSSQRHKGCSAMALQPPTCDCSGGLRMYTPRRSATDETKAEQWVATPELASGLLARPLNQATCSSFSQWLLTLRASRNAARAAPCGVTTCAAAQAACGGRCALHHGVGA
jgi:hypothetical protein